MGNKVYWSGGFRLRLREDLRSKLSGRVALVGVGNEVFGDDGVGPWVAQQLEQAGAQEVVDSGTTPELDTWRIREIAPDTVLFVDAVDFGGSPGEVVFLEPAALRRTGFDTHRPPLKLTMQYLEQDLNCKCFLLAIQPKDTRYESPMCNEVSSTARNIIQILLQEVFAPGHRMEK